MKKKTLCAGELTCAFLFASTMSIFAQGILTPPGAPAPTMKSLDEVEARTLIKALPYTINAEGSYYVTAKLTTAPSSAGITVGASNVTIDLNGFELIGSGGTTSGIVVNNGISNVTIRKGTIRNWGNYAIDGVGNSGLRVEDVKATGITGSHAFYLDQKATVIRCISDGNVGVGINVLAHSLVRDCQVIGTTGSPGDGISLAPGVADCAISGCLLSSNSGHGIIGGSYGTIENCTANSNTLNGINLGSGWSISHCSANGNSATGIVTVGSIISDCTSRGNTNGGAGFDVGSSGRTTNCISGNNNGAGIVANVQGTIKQCSVNSNTGDGIVSASNCEIAENNCTSNGTAGTDAGIHVTGTSNRIIGNVLINNTTRAVKVDSNSNLIIRNFVIGSTTPYDIANLNIVGKIISPAVSGPISGSSGGGLNAAGPEPDSFANFAN